MNCRFPVHLVGQGGCKKSAKVAESYHEQLGPLPACLEAPRPVSINCHEPLKAILSLDPQPGLQHSRCTAYVCTAVGSGMGIACTLLRASQPILGHAVHSAADSGCLLSAVCLLADMFRLNYG